MFKNCVKVMEKMCNFFHIWRENFWAFINLCKKSTFPKLFPKPFQQANRGVFSLLSRGFSTFSTQPIITINYYKEGKK
jgi:hypothetical protein